MATGFHSLGIDQHNHNKECNVLRLQQEEKRKETQRIKIEICIHGCDDGVLYHRKEILANKSWLISFPFFHKRKKVEQRWRCCQRERTQRRGCSSVDVALSLFRVVGALRGWRRRRRRKPNNRRRKTKQKLVNVLRSKKIGLAGQLQSHAKDCARRGVETLFLSYVVSLRYTLAVQMLGVTLVVTAFPDVWRCA